VVVKPRFEAYKEASNRVREILTRYSPDIEPAGLDEAYLGLTMVPRWAGLGRGAEAAREIKRAVREEVGLTASVGVSVNRFLAKVASDLKKPDGLAVISAEEAAGVLAPMPVGVLRGVGKVARKGMDELGIRTVEDLLRAPEEAVRARFGSQCEVWRLMARGEDPRAQGLGHAHARSIGKERTFGEDISDAAHLRAILFSEVEAVAASLRAEGLACRTIVVKLRLADFRTFSRSHSFAAATSSTEEMWREAERLLGEWLAAHGGRRLRLLGASAKELTAERQMVLFESRKSLDAVADAINQKLGKGAVRRGGGLGGSR
jgi:DNA polymerase-4